MPSFMDLEAPSSTPFLAIHRETVRGGSHDDNTWSYLTATYNFGGEANNTEAYHTYVYSFYLKRLTNREFFLKHEIELTVDMEDDGYILSNNTLNVHAFGETFTEAIEEWEYILTNIYLSYVNTPDDQLTPGGKMLKGQLQYYVGVIDAY